MYEIVNQPVTYHDFSTTRDETRVAGIRHLHRAVFIEAGWVGLAKLVTAEMLVLIPSALLSAYSFVQANPFILAWVLAALFSIVSSRPQANGCIGVFWLLAIPLGVLISQQMGWVHGVGGFLPIFSYFGGSAIKGVTLFELIDRVKKSEELFDELVSCGELFFVQPAMREK